jgi:hypothetical protein
VACNYHYLGWVLTWKYLKQGFWGKIMLQYTPSFNKVCYTLRLQGYKHMQNIIQIYPCLLKLSRKQDTILKIGDFSTKNEDFPPKPLL